MESRILKAYGAARGKGEHKPRFSGPDNKGMARLDKEWLKKRMNRHHNKNKSVEDSILEHFEKKGTLREAYSRAQKYDRKTKVANRMGGGGDNIPDSSDEANTANKRVGEHLKDIDPKQFGVFKFFENQLFNPLFAHLLNVWKMWWRNEERL